LPATSNGRIGRVSSEPPAIGLPHAHCAVHGHASVPRRATSCHCLVCACVCARAGVCRYMILSTMPCGSSAAGAVLTAVCGATVGGGLVFLSVFHTAWRCASAGSSAR
jgi:hypothetical protein